MASDFIWKFKGYIKRIVDGDTIVVDLDLGLDVWLRDQYVRLDGLNTPETRGKEKELGKVAKEYVESLLPVGSEVEILSEKYDPHGKYGRIIGYVFYTENDWNLNQKLIDEGYAIPYSGSGPIPRFDVDAPYPLSESQIKRYGVLNEES